MRFLSSVILTVLGSVFAFLLYAQPIEEPILSTEAASIESVNSVNLATMLQQLTQLRTELEQAVSQVKEEMVMLMQAETLTEEQKKIIEGRYFEQEARLQSVLEKVTQQIKGLETTLHPNESDQ